MSVESHETRARIGSFGYEREPSCGKKRGRHLAAQKAVKRILVGNDVETDELGRHRQRDRRGCSPLPTTIADVTTDQGTIHLEIQSARIPRAQ